MSSLQDFHHSLEKALAGELLTPAEAYQLVEAPEGALPDLYAAASQLRQQHKGHIVSYSRKVFIPLTTLCRDRCGYCTFVKSPGDPAARTLAPEEVLAIAEAGRRAGCTEALFSMGERPELRHNLARQHLRELGYSSMIDYLRAMCELTLNETGLLPHANAGTLTAEEIVSLREVNASLGMMLESVSERLTQPGQAHFGCPDKLPNIRLATLRFAGELHVPFSTGILVGIGETRRERVDALLAIRDLHLRYGHIQEVIVQNFRAKKGTRMGGFAEPSLAEMGRTLAVSRLVLGGAMNIQAPPNLMPEEYGQYLQAGINDWGGVSPVTPDHINPEAAWPKIRQLRHVTSKHGYTLRERLPIYPEYARHASRWLAQPMQMKVAAWMDAQGYADMEKLSL